MSGIGLDIPYDKQKDVGYREYGFTDKELTKLLDGVVKENESDNAGKHSQEWGETLSCVQFANDECDFGMGLHLGCNVFTLGHQSLRNEGLRLMGVSYKLLSRDA